MREILFRAKSEFDKNKKWVYGDLIQGENSYISTKEDFYSAVVSLGGNLATRVELIDKNTLGQYIGLKDKNGKKIFEGDIVLVNKIAPAKVFYNEENACYAFDYGENGRPLAIDLTTDESLEIIGNIFEDLELVKGESNGKS